MRKIFRVLAVAGALVFTVYQGVVFAGDYRGWQSSIKIGDRSGADLYRLGMKIDCAEILVAWVFAGGLVYVLRPKSPPKP